MNDTLRFLAELIAVLAISGIVTAYLRSVLWTVLADSCDDDRRRPEFWIRICDLLMMISPLILVIYFGYDNAPSLLFEIKRVLLLTLLGNFIGLVMVTRVIWKYLVLPRLDDLKPRTIVKLSMPASDGGR